MVSPARRLHAGRPQGDCRRSPAQAAGARRAPGAGAAAEGRRLRRRAGHAADLEIGAGAVPGRHCRRTGFVGEARIGLLNDLRCGRARPAAHDRSLRGAGDAEGRKRSRRLAASATRSARQRDRELAASATASPTITVPRSRWRRARSGRRSDGRHPAMPSWRDASPPMAFRSGSWAGRARRRSPPRSPVPIRRMRAT